jgi:hypothetical protein
MVNEFNTVCLPALEQAWGRSFKDEWQSEDPSIRTAEITKVLARPLNNVMFRHIHSALPQFIEASTRGYDWKFGDVPIEDKNSFSDGDSWTGNGFGKTNCHLLKKFQIDENGRIIAAFVGLVDLSRCGTNWTDKTIKSNFSSLKFLCLDKEHIHVIHGSVNPKIKYLSINLLPVNVP